MTLLDRLNQVMARLEEVPGMDVQGEGFALPASDRELRALEQTAGYALPSAVRQFMLHEAAGLRLSWSVPKETFGAECQRGYLYLLTPLEIAGNLRDLRGIADDFRNERDLDEDEGAAAAVHDWPFWIPLCRFPSGDYFCLDVRHGDGDYPVVFLEHDVVGDEPVVHGLRLAATFEDLLGRWGELGFVDLWDWTTGVTSDGINPAAPVFQRLRGFLSG